MYKKIFGGNVMEELKFKSFNDAMIHLANLTGSPIKVAAKSAVKNPREKPKNDAEKKNWDNKDMWGDPKNHKYPLFDNKTGELSAKRAKTALRYLNQAKSKASYPNAKARSQVLARIVRAILKADSGAQVDYQSRDKTYQALPESVKKKMKGYKMASLDSNEVKMAMRIAGEEEKEIDTKEDLKQIKDKLKNPNLNKSMSNLGFTGPDLAAKSPVQIFDLVADLVSNAPITPAEVKASIRVADAEVKSDLFELIKKSSSQKYEKTVKNVLGTVNINKVTVKGLIDMLRDAIGKADKDDAPVKE